MHRRVTTLSAAVLAAVFAAASPRPAPAQQVVVSVKSANAFFSDAKYLLSLLGQEGQGAAFDVLVNVLKGVDTALPISAGIELPDAPGAPPTLLLAIPVTDADAVVGMLKTFQLKAEKGGDDVYTVTPPQGQNFYLKFAKGHGWISNVAARLKKDLPDASSLVPSAAGTSVFSAAVRLDQIPDIYKGLFKSSVDQQLERDAEKREGETEAAHQARVAAAKIARDLLVQVVDEGAELTARLDIDQKQQRQVAYDVSVTAKPGSKLAGRIKALEDSRSIFTGLANDAAFSVFLNLPLNDDLRSIGEKIFKEATEDALKKTEDAKGRELAEKIFKSIAAAAATDSVDGAFIGCGPMEDGKYVLLGAAKVKDGKALDKTIRELVAEVGSFVPLTINLDLDKVGDAVVHQFRPNEEPDDVTKHFFGAKDVYIGIRADVVLFAVGSNGRAVIKEALETAGKQAPLIAPSMQAEIAVARILPALSFMNPARAPALIAKHFSGDDKGKDRMRMTLRGGQSLQLRLELNAAAVRAFIAIQRPRD